MSVKSETLTLKAHLAAGNTKLPATTAIFNMGSATRCPSAALGMCPFAADRSGACYALKPERQYPASLPYRERQTALWHSTSAFAFVAQFLAINARKRNPYNALRFNESGDFWTQACVDKAELIAKLLSLHGVRVYTYTHRKDLDFSGCSALVVNGSGFMVANNFKTVAKPSGKHAVCPADCRICDRCSIASGETIEAILH